MYNTEKTSQKACLPEKKGKMKGRKPISFSAESSKPAEDGGILAGRNGVGAMHPLDSPVNAQAPSEQLKLVAEGENKRPRFEEGFYELEAIRKKRLRQVNYFYLYLAKISPYICVVCIFHFCY